MKNPKYISVCAHNWTGFDCKLVVRAMIKLSSEEKENVAYSYTNSNGEVKELRFKDLKPEVIAKSGEKLPMLRWGPLRFTDTHNFVKAGFRV